MKLADQLVDLSKGVHTRLQKLPSPASPAEKSVVKALNAFNAECPRLRVSLSRWLVDKKPATQSLDRLNKHAWALHAQLAKSPRYKPIFNDWARTVSVLRKLNRALPRGR